jgi:shikimate kinase
VPGNIVLVGFSGTGKSTVGRGVAQRLGRPFVDVDALLVDYFGQPIAEVFRTHGEAAFRAAEADETRRICAETRSGVIALGGGAIVDDETFRSVRHENLLVRLVAAPETIYSRLIQQPGAEERPMLSGQDPLARLRALLAARDRRYREADVAVVTDGRPIADVVEEVIRVAEAPWPR